MYVLNPIYEMQFSNIMHSTSIIPSMGMCIENLFTCNLLSLGESEINISFMLGFWRHIQIRKSHNSEM